MCHSSVTSENMVNVTSITGTNYCPDYLDNSPTINGKSKSSLTVLIPNCQSLVAKRASSINLIVIHTPDIIIGSETWLKSTIKDHEIFPAGYAAYHHDHADGYGGVFIACRDTLISQIIHSN